MSFKDLNFKKIYNSERGDDLLNDFYIPALTRTIHYDRVAGYFSSYSFKISSHGLAHLIKNNGKIRLLINVKLSQDDYENFKKISSNESSIIELKLMKSIEEIKDELELNRFKVIGYMLKNKMLEIKIAYIKNGESKDYILHQKIGIMTDSAGNKISFSGSNNESSYGWKNNSERFIVSKSWEEFNSVEEEQLDFNILWEDLGKVSKTISLPKALEKKLIEIAPKSEDYLFKLINDVEITPIYTKSEENKFDESFELRKYQNEAIKSWKENKNVGILNLATGAGKTLIGVYSIFKFFEKKFGIVIISTPKREICSQWEEWMNKLKNVRINNEKCIIDRTIICSGLTNWKEKLSDELHSLSKSNKRKIVVISTNSSLIKVLEFILKNNQHNEIYFIGDEVHSLGSDKAKELLINNIANTQISFRMGLSATPERFYDNEGTKILNEFFNKTVYNFSLRDAIKERILCQYNYHISYITLTNKEKYEYSELTKKIVRKFYQSKSKEDEDSNESKFENLRAKILKKAENKYPEIKKILNKLNLNNQLSYTLIFCNDKEQVKNVSNILRSLNIYDYSIIVDDTNIESRNKIINDFKAGIIKIILSISIFDEGIDIKEAKNAIILSSSGNPREFIQRRGRVLRRNEKDEMKISNIFDFLIIPDLINSTINELELKILKKELIRVNYFLDDAKNYGEIIREDEFIKLNRLIFK